MAGVAAAAAGARAAPMSWLDSAPLRDYWTALAAVLGICLLGTHSSFLLGAP